MNRSFEDNLDKLRTRLIRMGSLVEEQVEFSLKALLDGNLELARIVIERDDKVDKLDLKIDKQCQRMFALNQPVASDLRLLLTAIKINNELERIGDMAVQLSAVALRAPGTVALAKEVGLERMTKSAFKMLETSINSFVNNSPDLAADIIPVDTTVAAQRDQTQDELIALMEKDPKRISDGAQLLICTHLLGRIADHATNIAENVIFLVRAKLIRHRSVNDDALDFGDLLAEDPGEDTDEGSPTS